MALVIKDRVKESSATTGAGTYTLAGAEAGFQTFAAIGNGNTTYYAATDGTNWEVGVGTYTTSGTTLARTTIISSSNGNAAVSWGAGEKLIFCTQPASNALVNEANVTAAGALMDSEVTNLAQVKAFDSTDYATSAQGTLAANALPRAGGTMSGDIAMGTAKISGLGTPSADADAATKGYVDTEVSALVSSSPSTLNTLNELAAAIGDDANFATTITNSIATKLPLAGGTMSGAIAMGTSKITGLGNPTALQDAATKAYTDTADALKLALAGGTLSGDLEFGDDDKAIFGAGSDLQIYHDSSTNKSHITESGSSHLVIQGQEIQFKNASGVALMDLNSAQVELRHSGNKKMETNSAGITVTGTASATSITLGDWTITEDEGGKLSFAHSGTVKMTLDDTGTLAAANDIFTDETL